MNLGEALAGAAEALGRPDGTCPVPEGTPYLDATLLLAHVLGVGKATLYASLREPADAAAVGGLAELVNRRRSGEPVAYILGVREFRGLDFTVDARVLVPRPETEHLVEAVLQALPQLGEGRRPRLHDAFAGSGCVGIAVAAERPDVDVSLSDASDGALELCRRNAEAILGRMLPCSRGDVLSSAVGPFDVIAANPPYVSSGLVDDIELGGRREPRMALDGGPDGLRFYRPLAAQALPLLVAGGTLAVEIGDEQGPAVAAVFRETGFADVRVLRDLAGLDRVVMGVRAAGTMGGNGSRGGGA